MEAKTHRKPAKRAIRISKKGNARQAIGTLKKNEDVFILTFGQFSMIDALSVVLEQTGPAAVSVASWTANPSHLDELHSLVESGAVTEFRFIVDKSLETRHYEYYRNLRLKFGFDRVRTINNHSKFMLIRNDKWDIVVRTSMNLNENQRLENIEISDNEAFAVFFQSVVDSIFSEVSIGEKRTAALKIEALQEEFVFKEIEAPQLERSRLDEPKTTHTIEKP